VSRYLRAARTDRAVRLGVAGGALTSLSGVVGYVVVPIVRRGRVDLEVGFVPLDALAGSPAWYHALVVGLVPLLAGLVGALAAPPERLRDHVTPVKLLGGTVLLPTVTALSLAILSALSLAAGLALGVAQPGERLFTFLLAVPFMLGWGALVAIPLVALVVVAVTACGATGYLFGVGLLAVRRGLGPADR